MGVVIKMRNGVMFTIKCCFRAVYNHPFVVCLLSVLIYMYRSSPFMFSLLVSASPILVCTAVLLGTLLFFGQSNIPEIGITSRDVVPQKTELSKDETKDESKQPTVRPESKVGEICSEDRLDVSAPLGNGEVLETNKDGRGEQKSEWNSDGEVLENKYASSRKANYQESEYDKSEAESFDSEMVNVDSLASSGRSSWKQVEQQGDEDDDEEDSGSDEAESSSPDASMADMMPMLDELHPLLDEDAPQPIQISRAGSEAVSEQSSISSIESVDETDNQEDSVAEDGEEDDDDDDDDDAQQKGFRTKSAITWTEEDQKNLMEVGSSEIERNQRLENLILRRKTRKHTSMLPEINLIDLETSDFPINIASISTSRQNPFDVPNDSYDPVPGSAPSILLPRRNPFDVPYDDDSSEQKETIMGDGSQEEHKTMQSRDPFFRRRENFNVGPSVFAPNRQDVKLRPYFVPERMDLEEPSYSTLQRQSSEMSDSKVSSVPDTESVSSVECGEDQKLEEDEEEVVTQENHVSKMELSEEDEPEVISEVKHVSEDVGHGSQSSEGEGCLELGSVENRESEVVNNVKFQSESEAVEQRHSRDSSISSLSEVSQRKIDDDVPHKEPVYDSSPPKLANDDIISDLSGVDRRSDENITDEQSQIDKNTGELERESAVPNEGRSVDNKETAMSPTSDAEFQEACEKISTPSAGGSAPHFYVRAMHEKDFEHLEEVQVPNTPVEPSEKARGIQSIHIPELQEQLDRDVSPNAKSSFISNPEEAVDTRAMNEDAADEIKDIHQGLLSELDSAGDFTSRDLEKHVDAERVSSPHFSETSAVELNLIPVEVNKIEHDVSVAEVDPVEVNMIQHELDMENSRGNEIEDIGADHKKEMMLNQEEVEPNTNTQVKEEKVESLVGEESSSVREDDPHSTSDTETEKNSKSSSSFSSFWAKRRLSTPFF